MNELLTALGEYGLAGGAVFAMFILARNCGEKMRAVVEEHTVAVERLTEYLKGRERG